MATVVIAAHDEAEILERCLSSLAASPTHLDVIVVANGCSDSTADIARRAGVHVVEITVASKVAALNAGDRQASTFPRIYLDADIVLPAEGIPNLLRAVEKVEGPLVAVPRRIVDVTGRPWPVRAYTAISVRLPVYERGLFGRGVVALSAAGRSRFGDFPSVIADDLFLDSLFTDDEREIVDDVQVVVASPHSTRALVRRLVRVRRGNSDLRGTARRGQLAVDVRPSDPWSWWRDVVRRDMRLLPAGVVYLVLTCWASLLARRPRHALAWGQDVSTRRPAIGARGPIDG